MGREVWVNSLPNDKIMDRSKLKAFADDNFSLALIIWFVCSTVENIVEKGENAVYQHFLLFQQCFLMTFFLWSLKIWDCLVKSH